MSGGYSADTDILTDRGWIPMADLTRDDRLATVSFAGDLLYAKPAKLSDRRYRGPMSDLTSICVDLLVAPDQRLFLRPQGPQGTYGFRRANELLPERHLDYPHRRFQLLNQLEWRGEVLSDTFLVPPCTYVRANHSKPLPLFAMGDWCEFVGFYLANGATIIRDRPGQSPAYWVDLSPPGKRAPEHLNEIRELLERMGFRFRFYSNGRGFNISNKQLAYALAPLGKTPERFIPRELLRLPRRHLARLYHGLMLGDGKVRPNQEMYLTSSSRLADDVQELLIKLGFGASKIVNRQPSERYHTLTGYAVNRRTSREYGVAVHRHVTAVDHDGMIYRCTVEPHHTLVVRRNGKPHVCGDNS